MPIAPLVSLLGVGFTTSESHSISSHPVRRQIVMTRMLLGNVGIVSIVDVSAGEAEQRRALREAAEVDTAT